MVALQVAFLTPGKELLKGTFCHHAKKCGKKRIEEHPIGRSVTDSPVRILYVVLSNISGERKKEPIKSSSMSGKFWWYTHAIKSFPSPAQPPPKKERCVMLSMRIPEKTVLAQKKKKAKAVLQTDVCRKKCVLWLDVFL